jgi:hypothetical protein
MGDGMTTQRILGLLSGLALTTLPAAPVAAQSIAWGETAASRRPAALTGAYHVRLRSAWPQAGDAGGRCRNGGEETVEGTLSRSASGSYTGGFDRRTLILFCGAHGAGGEACEIALEGQGQVVATAVVVPDETSPSGSALRVMWRPSVTHHALVRGDCSAGFKRAIEEMYLSVPHGAEFAIPAAGTGRRVERLENYAWTVEIE